MVASISDDLRKRVVDAYKRGGVTYHEVAAQFSVGHASVSRWLRRERETGDVAPKPHAGGRARLIGPEEEKALDKLVLAHPDWTEDEFAKALNEKLGRSYNASTVGRAIRRLGYGVKKNARRYRTRSSRRRPKARAICRPLLRARPCASGFCGRNWPQHLDDSAPSTCEIWRACDRKGAEGQAHQSHGRRSDRSRRCPRDDGI